MNVLTGNSLRDAISEVLRSESVSCAVAFWGRGAVEMIGPLGTRNIRLVCNLKMGGTNPDVIEELLKLSVSVRQHDRLHAKIYINSHDAIISSSNCSVNGLGLEGNELAGWLEAGIKVPASDVISLFDKIWQEGRDIKPGDLVRAARLFKERKISKPSVGNFSNFDLTDDEFPLIIWGGDLDYTANKESIKKQLGFFNQNVEGQIDRGFEVEATSDLTLFKRGRWVLTWSLTQSRPLYLSCSSGIEVKKAYSHIGERKYRDVVLALDTENELFDVRDPKFKKNFKALISEKKYTQLRDEDYKGSFLTSERLLLMRKFWEHLQDIYNKT